jgi:hypothetical protein
VAGKMTSVERAFNKDDLLAYKAFDGNQYALVPGVTSQARIFDRSKLLQGMTPTPQPAVPHTVQNSPVNNKSQLELYPMSAESMQLRRDAIIGSRREQARAASTLDQYS